MKQKIPRPIASESEAYVGVRLPPFPFDDDIEPGGTESREEVLPRDEGTIRNGYGRGFYTGIITTTIQASDDVMRAAAISTDGSAVYVAGRSNHATTKNDFFIARLYSDGTFNTHYSGDGWNVTDLASNSEDMAHAVSFLTGGKVVVGGRSQAGANYKFAVARYMTNGVLDTTFNTTGYNVHTITSTGFLRGIFAQTDGEVAATGYANVSGFYEFATVRYQATGELDTTWGTNGAVTTPVNSNKDNCATGLSVMSSGKVYVVGGTYDTSWEVGILRYMTNGVLDTTFNTTGKITNAVSAGDDILWALVQNNDEKLIGAGETNGGSNQDFLLMRYMTMGVLDTTFSSDGIATNTVSSGHDIARAIGIDGNQKFTLSGSAVVSGSTDFALVRFHTNGSQDTGWLGQGGFSQTMSANEDTGLGGTIMTDGTFYAVGRTSNGSNYDFALNITRPAMWVQQAYLKPPNASSGDQFGSQVWVDGDYAIVSAPKEDSNATGVFNGATASADNSTTDSGAAYIFARTGSTWAMQAYLKPSVGGSLDEFGSTQVALSGDTAVVSVRNEDSIGTTIISGTVAVPTDDDALQAGAAYVYRRTGTQWAFEAYMKSANLDSADAYGVAISIDGDTLAIAATSEDSNQTTISNDNTASADDSATNVGAVYVYQRTGTLWQQQAYIKVPNQSSGDTFGQYVKIDGDVLAAGISGEDSASSTIQNGSNVGSADDSVTNTGAVAVFRRTGSQWAQEAFLKAVNPSSGDLFGNRVALSGNTIVVGMLNEDNSTLSGITAGSTIPSDDENLADSGAAYVFVRDGTDWKRQAYFKSGNPTGSANFGNAVAIEGDRIAVSEPSNDSSQNSITNGTGFPTDSGMANSGAVWMYVRNGSTWVQEAYIKPSVTGSNDTFGTDHISLSGNTLIVGAKNVRNSGAAIVNGTASGSEVLASDQYGAAYIFTIR